MKTTWRLLLALVIAVAISACKTTPPISDEPATETTEAAPVVEEATTSGAPDPRDYTDARNFDNSQSLLSRRVIYFDFDKSEVKAEYRAVVAAHAAYISANGSSRVTLEGHADERGTREYNLGLGERRGNSVSGLLAAGGAMGSQLDNVSYGEERPVCRVSDEDCWSQNRRVEIIYTAR
ncbi:MAG: peptidoglycan-associated lipoprotein Pal [Gammaproteobacteria bacterium]|nr:MAG: peptidoglycan-associated lipoprotein Pal [Gammaproteobacteria bacterium]